MIALARMAVLYAYLPWIVGLAILIVLAWSTTKLITIGRQLRHDREMERIAREKELSWRADYQDFWARQDDPIGVYGNYPPRTMPLMERYEGYDTFR